MKFNKANASYFGSKGGRSRRRITLPLAVRELGKLETIEDAKRRLDRLMSWGAAGLIPGTMVHGLVRAVEVWIRSVEADASFDAIEKLRDAVSDLARERDVLKAELDRVRSARGAA